MIKFVFRNGETEKSLSHTIKDDECITPGRTLRIAINTAFLSDNYGYTISTTAFEIPVDGNDTTNSHLIDHKGLRQDCSPLDEDATEEFIGNHAPQFDSPPPTLKVAENTAAGEDIGDAVSATDPDNTTESPNTDMLTYGLTGTDAASFDIDTTIGQIRTKAELDHESKETYSVTVTVSDGREDAGGDEQTPVVDATINVTVTVTDLDEPGTIILPIAPPSAGNPVTAVLDDQDGIKQD